MTNEDIYYCPSKVIGDKYRPFFLPLLIKITASR